MKQDITGQSYPSELRRRIHQFSQWHYQFDLQGEITPIFDPGHINRH